MGMSDPRFQKPQSQLQRVLSYVARDSSTSRGRATGKLAGSAAVAGIADGTGYSINDAPLSLLRDCGLSDEMARAIVSARKQQPFDSVGDCVSRIRKLGRTKLLKLEARNITIPRQPPGRKPSKPNQRKVSGGAARGASRPPGEGRKRKRRPE